MIKRIIGGILAAMMLLTSVYAAELTPGASSILLPTGYMPGGSHYVVNAGDFIEDESTLAEIEDVEYVVGTTTDEEGNETTETATKNAVKINAGGEAKFGFNLRNAARGVKITYTAAAGTTLTMKSGDNEYTFTLDGSGEETFLFYESLSTGAIDPQVYGYNGATTGYYYREFVEKRGEKEVFVSADAEVSIEELAFEKEKLPAMVKCDSNKEPIVDENDEYTVTTVEHKMSDEERAFMTTVVMDERASAIFVKGAHRYISNEETDMRPYNNNGTLYIPIETLAKALGYYCEDNADLGYALMRSDTHEVAMIGGECTVTEGVGAAEKTPFDVFVYRNGKTLAAVRYFAELAGKTVAYDNGLVVIDNKYAVSDILNTPAYREYAEKNLNDFKKITVIGKTYYVSQEDGDDYNPGTASAPFATISKAAGLAEAGDTVIVKDGVYEETLKPANSGSANAPITFIADGENVVISAADEVKDWEWVREEDTLGIADIGKDVYRAYVGSDWDLGATQNQVFVNDVMQTEARYPDGPGVLSGDSPSLSNAWPVRGGFERVAGVENVLKVQGSDLLAGQADNYWQGGYYVGLFGHAYHITTGKIESSTSEELTIGKERSSAWYNVPASDTADGNDYNYGYIVGHKNALNTEGEWIKDGDYIYMIPESGVSLNSATVSVKKRNFVVDLNDKSFVNVIGFKTIGGSVGMDNSTMCMANGLDMKYISHYIHTADGNTGYIDFKTSMENKNYTDGDETATYPRYETYVAKDGAPERGKVGNYISGTDNIFINNKVDHSAGAGVYLSGAYSYIDNNAMNDVGYAGSLVAGIIAAPKKYEGMYANVYGGHSVYNNTVENSGHSFWTVNSYGGSQMPYMPCEVAYNEFRNGMLTSADTGMTYEYFVNMGYDGVMSELHHNYIYLTTEEEDLNTYSFGIYHDGSSMGVDTYDNKIFYTEQGSGYSMYAVYEQTAEWAAASHTLWNNTQIGYMPGGTDTFEAGYFTEGKPFHAGAKDSNYLKNYDGIKGYKDYGLSATTATSNFSSSTNVTVDENSGYADFSADGEYVKFRVNAPSGSNTLGLAVRGDSHYTYDELDIYITAVDGAMTSGEHYSRTVEINAHDLDTPEMVYLHINEISGAKDIYVKATDYRSAQIGGVSVFAAEGAKGDENWVMKTYAGNFNKQGSNSTAYTMTPSFRNPLAIGAASVNTTYKNWLGYSNCNFSAAADKLVISATAGPLNSGGYNTARSITVYVTEQGDTMANAIVTCNFTVANTEWDEKGYQIVDIGEEIASGTYDVYLYFPDEGSITVRDFGFLKTGADISGLVD